MPQAGKNVQDSKTASCARGLNGVAYMEEISGSDAFLLGALACCFWGNAFQTARTGRDAA